MADDLPFISSEVARHTVEEHCRQCPGAPVDEVEERRCACGAYGVLFCLGCGAALIVSGLRGPTCEDTQRCAAELVRGDEP
ncbi:MAG: hypothetical protein WCD11_07420 [Solirubrobacteraceae bacterium]